MSKNLDRYDPRKTKISYFYLPFQFSGSGNLLRKMLKKNRSILGFEGLVSYMAAGKKPGIQRRLKFYFVFFIFTQQNLLFPKQTMYLFQRRHCVFSAEDKVCFPERTMFGFKRGHCVVSTKDNVCFPKRTRCGSHRGQCVLSKEHNVCFPKRTMCAFQRGQFVVSEPNQTI